MSKVRTDKTRTSFNIFGYIAMSVISIICILPFLLVLSGSFTREDTIYKTGYSIIPPVFSTESYGILFAYPKIILDAYGVTIMVTAIGTFLGLFFMSMAGYVLHRKDVRYRNHLSFFIYFTTLFNGGLIPWYILMVRFLNLSDSYLALILPGMMGAFNIIIMRTFLRSIPDEIIESAKIDGANDFRIYMKLILPLSGASLATVGLFLALDYWNNWFNAALYINSTTKYPLQYYLYNMIAQADFIRKYSSAVSASIHLPSESMKMATAIVVIGPIIFLYPFVQKYFVKGLTVGAVKG
jgi:putative aldouronate transport system permease protein